MQTFKKRWKIIQDEIIDKKGSMIYLEKNIRNLMKRRYKPEQIDLESSYVYEKMQKLVEKKIYMKTWNMTNYAYEQGYINVFDLHKQLGEMIKNYHMPNKHLNIYTLEERQYMEQLADKGEV